MRPDDCYEKSAGTPPRTPNDPHPSAATKHDSI
jgi:hypothetical protein